MWTSFCHPFKLWSKFQWYHIHMHADISISMNIYEIININLFSLSVFFFIRFPFSSVVCYLVGWYMRWRVCDFWNGHLLIDMWFSNLFYVLMMHLTSTFCLFICVFLNNQNSNVKCVIVITIIINPTRGHEIGYFNQHFIQIFFSQFDYLFKILCYIMFLRGMRKGQIKTSKKDKSSDNARVFM